jgi:hypothetical protein
MIANWNSPCSDASTGTVGSGVTALQHVEVSTDFPSLQIEGFIVGSFRSWYISESHRVGLTLRGELERYHVDEAGRVTMPPRLSRPLAVARTDPDCDDTALWGRNE